MKILALEKEMPGFIAEDYRPHLKPEAARAWELYQAGIIREIYFTATDHNAVLILECASVEEAREILYTLPLVQAGLTDFELLALEPYDGFSRLFERKGDTRPLTPLE
ncbi:MAG: superoxide dismutase [Anaerolineae bacterium]|jgi:muconolactone delta-isomerase|nr:superoxide dismutase [Anaerolineae bacterium]